MVDIVAAAPHVTRSGVIFRCGEYKDKNFCLTPDEARAAIARFKPVPINLQHTKTVLDGKLGRLERVWMGEDGESIYGEAHIPAWFHDLFPGEPMKVSGEFDRVFKDHLGLGVVTVPRVDDAALMSDEPNEAYFVACEWARDSKDIVSMSIVPPPVAFDGKRHNIADQALVERGHKMAHAVAGIFVGLGATPAEGSPQEEAGESPATEAAETTAGMSKGAPGMTDEKKQRTFSEKFAAWFSGEDVTDADRAAVETRFSADTTPVTVREVVEAAPQPDLEKDAMRREIARLRERDVERDAAAFADGEVTAKRALPGERDALVAEFTQAAHDDLANPATVTFSVGDETKSGNRVDAVRARHAIRLPHRLTEELVKNITEDEHLVLMSAMQTRQAGTEAKPSDERMRRLNEASPLGRASLAAKK